MRVRFPCLSESYATVLRLGVAKFFQLPLQHGAELSVLAVSAIRAMANAQKLSNFKGAVQLSSLADSMGHHPVAGRCAVSYY